MNWFKKISSKIVPMTPAEANWANWALDVMWEYWCDESRAWERDGEVYDESFLPKTEGNSLVLSPASEINEDLLYRLEEQSSDTSECDAGSEQQKAARCRAAFSLANKIRGVQEVNWYKMAKPNDWNDARQELMTELKREPTSYEIQEKMLQSDFDDDNKLERGL